MCNEIKEEGKDFEKELNEAIHAADYAIKCLNDAAEHLSNARSIETCDTCGNGLVTTLIKHGEMDDAQDDIEEAQISLQKLNKELADVDKEIEVNFNISEFLSITDYFFQGLIVDWLVQERIRGVHEQMREIMEKVEIIREALLKMQGEIPV